MTEPSVMVKLEQTRTALDNVRRTLDTAINQIKAWQESPDVRPSAAEMQQHRDLLLMAYARYRVLQDDYAALLNLNARLLRQHESAKEAYQKGWEHHRIGVEARATTEEYALLRRLLDDMDNADMPY